MKSRNSLITAVMVLACTTNSFGAITQEEANKLGTTLTAIGAEKAGNSDGSIPAYTGGLTTPPAAYKKGSTMRPDPYANEKPLYSITSKNLETYKGFLTKGTEALLKKYPTYRVDVYKTHRSVSLPKSIQDNTVKTALTAQTTNNGLSLSGAHAAFPFPIPKNGIEAMWNHQARYVGEAISETKQAYYTNSAGGTTMVNQSDDYYENPYWVPGDKSGVYQKLKTTMTGPPRRAGEAIMLIDPLNIAEKGRSAWQYLPGQRRVKLAPEIAYDTPDFNISGVTTFDDVFLYNGAMDRYDFKLAGKKEIIIPYNCYKLVYGSTPDKLFGPKHLNPDDVRWEKHRVWVIEATLKPGKRHLYAKRTFYVDEDSWTILASDQYDGRNQLYRAGFAYMTPSYDVAAPYSFTHGLYDLIANSYSLNFYPAVTGGVKYTKPFPSREWSSDSLAGSGVR
jgi:hypothetical protein